MFKKYLSSVLVGLLVFSATSPLILAQTKIENYVSNLEKIKAIVLKRSTDDKKRVRVKMLNATTAQQSC